MKFSTATIVTAAAIGSGAITASAQTISSPDQLIQYFLAFLSPQCRSTVTGLLAPNSSLGACLDVQGIGSILQNNQSSIVPDIDTYLRGICSSAPCSNATIQNATLSIGEACSTELSYFGITNETLADITGAYPTAREVVCLSTNATSSNSTTVKPTHGNWTHGIPLHHNATDNTTTNSTLCPTSFLTQVENFLGVPLTNSFVDTLLVGANATAYNQVVSVFQNVTILQSFVCTDCVIGAVDVVLQNYPQLTNKTFTLPGSNWTLPGSNLTFPGYHSTGNYSLPGNASLPTSASEYTIVQLFGNVCNATVGPNVTLPSSLNETAFNTTLPYANATTPSRNITARSLIAKSRFRRWD